MKVRPWRRPRRTASALAGLEPDAITMASASRRLFRLSQALEDAMVFRRARVSTYCADCEDAPGDERCDDHAIDLALIAGYEQDARAVSAAIPKDVGRLANAR